MHEVGSCGNGVASPCDVDHGGVRLPGHIDKQGDAKQESVSNGATSIQSRSLSYMVFQLSRLAVARPSCGCAISGPAALYASADSLALDDRRGCRTGSSWLQLGLLVVPWIVISTTDGVSKCGCLAGARLLWLETRRGGKASVRLRAV